MTATRPELTRGTIAAAALRVHRSALATRPTALWRDAVTMRSVALELGCSPMAAYRHVADRDELTLVAIDRALEVVSENAEAGLKSDPRIRLPDGNVHAAVTASAYIVGAVGALGPFPGIALELPHAPNPDSLPVTAALLGVLDDAIPGMGRVGFAFIRGTRLDIDADGPTHTSAATMIDDATALAFGMTER